MAQPKITYAYLGNLTKSRDDKGYLHVKGLATDDTLDLDQQVCDPEWLKAAMPQWFKTGNIREMHQLKAVGKAMEMTSKGTGFAIDAKIVDAGAAEKVEEDIYTGFSIGIKGARVDRSESALEKAPQGIINGGQIIEVSLVDIPSNPSAKLELAKTVGDVLVKTEVVTDGGLPCPKCNGTGEMTDPENGGEFLVCDQCGGTGEDGNDVYPSLDGGDKEDGYVDEKQESKTVEAKTAPAELITLVDLLSKSGELNKAGEVHDPAQLSDIRDALVAVIKAELDEFATGDDERWDVDQLTTALNIFLSWWQDEASEGETASPFSQGDAMSFVGLGVSADIIKAATSDEATDIDKDALKTSVLQSLGLEDVVTIKAATEGLQQEINRLNAELDSVKKMAAPRSVSLRATQFQQSRFSEVEALQAKAEQFKSIARDSADPETRRQYMEASIKAAEEAASIRKSLEGDN